MEFSGNQIRKLGRRLAEGEFPTADDLDLLAQYERSFIAPMETVVRQIRTTIGRDSTARLKTVSSIVEKVRREHTSLPRMQDIAGCRLVVHDLTEQDAVVERLTRMPWEGCRRYDLREKTHHGYRAVHVVVTAASHPVEVQVRTRLQDIWAQLSEQTADRLGLVVKYGQGPTKVRDGLISISERLRNLEHGRLDLDRLRQEDALEEALYLQQAVEAEIELLMEELDQFAAMVTS